MKITSKFTTAFTIGSLCLTAASSFGAVQWQPALLALSTGQLRFFESQPEADPFQAASGEVDKLINENKTQAKVQAAELLRSGRQALAQGNLPAATFYHDRAVELGVRFAADEDSPARLAADIQRQSAPSNAVALSPNGAPPVSSLTILPGTRPQASDSQNVGPRYSQTAPNPPAAALPLQPGSTAFPAQQASGTIQLGPSASRAVFTPRNDNTFDERADYLAPSAGGGVRLTSDYQPSSGNAAGSSRRAVVAQAPTPYEPPTAGLPYGVQTPPYEVPLPPTASGTPTPLQRPPAAAAPVAPPATLSPAPQVLANPAPLSPAPAGQLLEDTAAASERLKRQILAEVARQSREALDIRKKNPLAAAGMLTKTRAMVAESALGAADKQLVLTRVSEMIDDTEKYIQDHQTEIELAQQNKSVRADLERQRDYKLEVQQRLQKLVGEYNQLRNEQRFYEAEVKAKEARELAPDEPVVDQMWSEIKFHRRVMHNEYVREQKETGVWQELVNVDEASVPMDSNNPIVYADKITWDDLTNRRKKFAGDGEVQRHPSEIEIQRRLSTLVSMRFNDAPLAEVVEYMKRVSGINIYLDPQGLTEEGVHPSTPVTIDLANEIQLSSALKLILEPLHLNYVITNEVLKITSEQLGDRTVYPKIYNVGDLVVPIPDFVPHDQLGIPTALARGYDMNSRQLAGVGNFGPPVISMAQQTGAARVATPDVALAQTGLGTNPGRPGGTGQADFDALIELITKTISPDSWDEVGGPGSIAEFETNLSLVISQTQEIHEKIADLLEQLRRLQDLQVTIEVRFITLRDDFFEKIGIDFDFNIDDNVGTLRGDDRGQSNLFGLDFQGGQPTGQAAQPGPITLPNNNGMNDIRVQQGSFPITPPFGGFNPAAATTFGIAILSDIEAYFLVQAAQGDTRTNITQAPKVTLFNGQAASISDQVQQPFVISVTPIVGDFAAAQAPVIAVLGEGTTLSVQAVVSPDRRFVRLTLIPFFSDIQAVNEFTFTGKRTSSEALADALQGNIKTSSSSSAETFDEGVTLQLPTFAFTTVTTTVSVPDGGTVLLGGVKRLREGRNEQGTPFLSKVPYISRLFKNVAIGRESESLMLMVTPRIIIQEEEEEKLGLALP